jgi:hypothetical protein
VNEEGPLWQRSGSPCWWVMHLFFPLAALVAWILLAITKSGRSDTLPLGLSTSFIASLLGTTFLRLSPNLLIVVGNPCNNSRTTLNAATTEHALHRGLA